MILSPIDSIGDCPRQFGNSEHIGGIAARKGVNNMQIERLFVRIFHPLLAFVLVVLWNGTPAVAQEKLEKTLYERLGGVYNIATVVDDFIERLLVNDVLNANPAVNGARDRVPKAGLKYRVTSLVCQVTGGTSEIYRTFDEGIS